jgi:hypothetical protein
MACAKSQQGILHALRVVVGLVPNIRHPNLLGGNRLRTFVTFAFG